MENIVDPEQMRISSVFKNVRKISKLFNTSSICQFSCINGYLNCHRFIILMENIVNPDQMVLLDARWSGSTVFSKHLFYMN